MSRGRIFVFGSNLQGQHASGSAAEAHRRGYPWSLGSGFHKGSRCYAVPTMSGYAIMALYIEQLLDYARQVQKHSPRVRFQITRIGCGIAGFRDDQVASLFCDAPTNCLFDRKWEMGGWLKPKAKFWGTF